MTEGTLKTIDIFLDALNEGTLAKGNCKMCAVGNICATVDKENPGIWVSLFFTDADTGVQIINSGSFLYEKRQKARELIAKTGYTQKELMEIEHTFETSTKIHHSDYNIFSKEKIRADQINGLKAVVELLLSWDEDKTSAIEKVFTKRAEAIAL